MRWVVKAAIQNSLAYVPKGREINHLLQRKLTGSLPGDDEYFRLKARKAGWHFGALERHVTRANGRVRLFEFGAGWDLVGPLIYYALGVDEQVVIDLAVNLKLDLVECSIRQYALLRSELETALGRPLRSLGDAVVRSTQELDDRFGIRYIAPCDASDTGLPSDSVDFVSSTGVLQHVPEQQLRPILEECRRLLRPSGVLSCHIDMQDGFAEFDHTLSQYNFLKFSDRTWALVNSPFYYQNRLRARDYVALVKGAGFDVVEREDHWPSAEQVAQLRKLRLASRLRTYSIEEVAVIQMSVVAVNR